MDYRHTLPTHAQQCHKCKDLIDTQPVWGTGIIEARICLLGRNPGKFEKKQRVPFAGPAGTQQLMGLAIARILKETCWTTNIVKCPIGTVAPKRYHYETCIANHLEAELASLTQLQLIVAYGRQVLHYFQQPHANMERWHGKYFLMPQPADANKTIAIFATFQPGQALRDEAIAELFNADMIALRDLWIAIKQGELL